MFGKINNNLANVGALISSPSKLTLVILLSVNKLLGILFEIVTCLRPRDNNLGKLRIKADKSSKFKGFTGLVGMKFTIYFDGTDNEKICKLKRLEFIIYRKI